MREKLLTVGIVASMAFGPIVAGFAGIAMHDAMVRSVQHSPVQYCVLDSTGFEWYCSVSPIKGTEVK